MKNDIKLNSLIKTINPKLWLSYLIIMSFMLLSSISYAFWVLNYAVQPDIVLQSDAVTYFSTYLYADNENELLIPAVAQKDSLANSNIVIETPASVIERNMRLTLVSDVDCDILIIITSQYKDTEGNFIDLANDVFTFELWCDFDLNDNIDPYLLNFDNIRQGYIIESFKNRQISNLMLKISFSQIDELIDPFYKLTDYKIITAFEAIKLQ